MSWPEAITEAAKWLSIPASIAATLWGLSMIIKAAVLHITSDDED